MWVYIVLVFLLLLVIGKIQEYYNQKREKKEREDRIRKNVQTGAFDHKKKIFYNLSLLSNKSWLMGL